MAEGREIESSKMKCFILITYWQVNNEHTYNEHVSESDRQTLFFLTLTGSFFASESLFLFTILYKTVPFLHSLAYKLKIQCSNSVN